MFFQVTETRLTGLGVDILMVLCAVLLPNDRKLGVPSVAFGGILLYMGLSSLQDNHLFIRSKLFFMDPT